MTHENADTVRAPLAYPERPHWTETAERVADTKGRYVGEDPNGDLFVPSRKQPGWWDRRLNLRHPAHWPYWLRSRLTKRLAWLEDE